MTTVKGGGWAHLSCVFWHEKPTFENIMQVLFGARCFGFYVVPCCFEHAVVVAALRALVLNIFVMLPFFGFKKYNVVVRSLRT